MRFAQRARGLVIATIVPRPTAPGAASPFVVSTLLQPGEMDNVKPSRPHDDYPDWLICLILSPYESRLQVILGVWLLRRNSARTTPRRSNSCADLTCHANNGGSNTEIGQNLYSSAPERRLTVTTLLPSRRGCRLTSWSWRMVSVKMDGQISVTIT